MQFFLGRGFAVVKTLKKSETGRKSLTRRNILMTFRIHIDIDKI